MKIAKQPFYQFFFFFMLKTHTHMQMSYKPVFHVCHDFKSLMHTSKGEEIKFEFLLIQFRFVR